MNHYHYTYIVEGLGKRYIGVRTCKHHPTEDTDYFGSSKYLNQAIQENGVDKFSKTILAIFGTRKHAMEYEIRLHEHFDVGRSPLFWNQAKHTSTGFDVTGNRHSEETKRKISLASKGRIVSEKTKQKMRKPKSEETKQKMRKSKSDESRLKMSESTKGHVVLEETKQKIREANIGRRLSEETKLKLSKAHKGKTHTEETKLKLSESLRGQE